MATPRSLPHRICVAVVAVVFGIAAVGLGGAVGAAAAPVAPTVSWQVTSDWGSGFQVAVTVTNPQAAISGWRLSVPFAHTVTSVWDATTTRSGATQTFGPAAWNATLAAGGSVSFGFVATATTAGARVPAGCDLNGTPCTITTGTAPTVPTTSTPTTAPPTTLPPATTKPGTGANLALTVTTTSDWGTGRNADVEVRNVGTTTVTGWNVDFAWPVSVSSIWNATGGAVGGRVSARNADWNGTLAPGASTRFGFTASPGGPIAAASDAHCNATACSITTAGASAPTTTVPPATTLPPVTTVPPTTLPTPGTTLPPTGAGPLVAPYVDMGLWPTPDLARLSADSGVRTFSLAFVLSGGPDGCTPAWFGSQIVGGVNDDFGARIAALRAAGGDVIVSFGGANGTELSVGCSDETKLLAAYRSVVTTYGLRAIDLDVEGGAVSDAASVARRSRVLARLQAERAAAGVALSVSLTLPVLPSGLTADGVAIARSAAGAGLDIDVVNVMAMDYGDAAAPNPDGRMGSYAMAAAQATATQVGTAWPSLTDAQRRRKVGITPMIGRNDTATEVFTVSDARTVRQGAVGGGYGRLAYWATGRDKPCPAGTGPWAQATCSGVSDPAWAFAAAFRGA